MPALSVSIATPITGTQGYVTALGASGQSSGAVSLGEQIDSGTPSVHQVPGPTNNTPWNSAINGCTNPNQWYTFTKYAWDAAGNSTRQSSSFQPAPPPGPGGMQMQPETAAFMADIELAPIKDVSHNSTAVWQVRLRAGSKNSYKYHLWHYFMDPLERKLHFPDPAQDVRAAIDLSSIVKEHKHTCIYKGTHYVMMLVWKNTGKPPTHMGDVDCQMQPFTVS
jgi:hypothetical protein